MERHVFRPAVRLCLLCFAAGFATTAMAGTPGLPFTEDFSDATLQDPALTNANWSTEEQALVLAWRQEQYGGFYDSDAVDGSNISDDVYWTTGVTLGDVDGDGDLDLVAASYNTSPNRLYLNDGTGNFGAGSDIDTDAQSTLAVVLGDVDGDGDLDLIAGNDFQTNRLYRNNGSGVFDGGTDISADTRVTRSLALADIDGDGDLDLVVGNGTGSQVTLHRNDGEGNFGGEELVGVDASDTSALAVGDVDGDGDPDVVAVNRGQANRFYRNNGAGSFDAGTAITSSTNDSRAMALGDVDGDGDLDLVVGNFGQINRLYLNDGDADPWDSVVTGEPLSGNLFTLGMTLQDIDGDGDLDLITANANNKQNRLFVNDGFGTFGSDLPISGDFHSSYGLATGDLDNDGDLDLIIGNFGSANRLYLNTGNASPWNGVSGSNIPSSGQNALALALGDVDGDGDLDLVSGNAFDTNRLYRNDGSGGFTANGTVTDDSDLTAALLMADVDGDGDLDLIAGNQFGDFNRVYLNDDGLGASWIGSDLPGSDSQDTTSLALGDVDGDGDPDLIVGNQAATHRLYRNDGSGGFTANGNVTDDAHVTTALQMFDVDGDGDLDLIAGNVGGDPSRVYLNADGLGSSWIGSDLPGSNSQYPRSLALGDVDGDGDPDLVLGNDGQTNQLYRNDGSGGFTAAGSIGSETDNTRALSLVDVDGDGDLDLITGNATQVNRLYLNNGSSDPFANVNATDISTDTHFTSALAVGDVDGDGDPDLIAGNNNGQPNRLYLNRSIPDPWGGVSSNALSGSAANKVVVLGDVDRDGDIDLIAGNAAGTEPKRLYLNNGSIDPWVGVTPVSIGSEAGGTRALALGDVDGDGDLDLVDARANAVNRYYLGDGSGGFDSGSDISSDADNTAAIVLGDVDRDGDLDVIAGNDGVADRLYLNNGTADPWRDGDGGSIVSATDLPGAVLATQALALGDVDRDGDLDLIAANAGAANRLYLNDNSPGVFGSASGITTDADLSFAIVLGDVDHDGDLDLIAGNYGAHNRLYLNNGGVGVSWSGFANGGDVDSINDNTLALALGDLDADGDLDLFAGNQSGVDRYYLNDGSGVFDVGIALSPLSGLTQTVAVADVDGDGVLDVFADNRLYQRRLFHTSLDQGASLRVDDGSAPDIVGVVLSADSMEPPNTSVDYWLSNDGGAQWFQAPLDRPFFFPTVGADLRWKATLHSSSPALTPLVDSIRIVDMLIFSDGFED
ncbi:MAG: VCBS repeat-containing protein [Rhodanobacteraceae bacterium]|nr:VCBS repeat-containing protein [Xanthomonadales bacterium]MCP5478694.1 VCBS repeat-containing protein [Rhodanobacteraceae bacterium]